MKETIPQRTVARDVRTIPRRSIIDRRVNLGESIVYLCALIADQPRAIDRYIDYFGETRSVVGVAP